MEGFVEVNKESGGNKASGKRRLIIARTEDGKGALVGTVKADGLYLTFRKGDQTEFFKIEPTEWLRFSNELKKRIEEAVHAR